MLSLKNNERVEQNEIRETGRQKDQIAHFDFLDGFRGLCAFIVIVIHAVDNSPNINYTNTIFRHMYINGSLVQAIAMPGFFLLSSFLLTYRLTVELNEELTGKFDKLKIILDK